MNGGVHGPLSGIQVIEFCTVAAGPFCGMLLADLGADVIKVEHPRGDSMRSWPPLTEGYSENFASVNRNKRSVTLDMKQPEQQRFARELVMGADAVIENNRPGVMRRLGLDYPVFRALKPSLVYCSISAFGQQGPRAEEGGFDLTLQAMSGIMSVTGEPDGPPIKCGVPLTDFSAGLYGAMAVCAALRQVAIGGMGAHIDVPMLGTSLAIAALQMSEFFGSGKNPGKLGSAHPRNAPYQAFEARDGHVAVAAGNDGLWASFCRALGREDLLDDARFASTGLRATNQRALKILLDEDFVSRTVQQLLALFRKAGVPCAPINNYSEALLDEQVVAMAWVKEIDLPNGNGALTFGSPLRFVGEELPIYRNPPALGEHDHEILDPIRRRLSGLEG